MSQTTNSTIPEIIIHVAPDNKAAPVNIKRKEANIVYSKIGYKTLENLLIYLECYKVDAKILPRPLPDFIFDAIEVWKHDFKIDEVDKFQRDGKFIANPIKIILEPGEYAITQVIRVYTIADFSIIGPEEKEDEEEKVAIIEFSRNYEYNGAIFTYYEIDSKGSNCLACFSSPTANEQVPAFKKDNCFKLQNLTLRMRDGCAEGGLFYPFIDKYYCPLKIF